LKRDKISDAVIRRLPRYYRHLTELYDRNVERVSSGSLGQKLNITASQIRQDFCYFGEFGQQGYGYNVEKLRAEIGHILGVDRHNHLILIGVGNLGRTLLQSFPFSQTGFLVDAAFDNSPVKTGTTINDIPIRPMDEIGDFVRRHAIDVVVLTVPQSVAQDITNQLVELGIQGFWNFTNMELYSTRPNVKFENIHFADSLLTLSYRISNADSL
jgi:redox-sensing transcriptional repressor